MNFQFKNFQKVLFFPIFFFGIFGLVKISQATTAYYVCDTGSSCGSGWVTGNNSNPCTSKSSPCKTINGGIGKAGAGDTIIVGNGTYTRSGTNQYVVQISNKSGTSSSYMTLKSENKWGAKIDCGETSWIDPHLYSCSGDVACYGILFAGTDSYWNIENFEIKGKCRSGAIWINSGLNHHHVNIKNNYIHEMNGQGAYIGNSVNNITFDSNYFLNNGYAPSGSALVHDIYIWGSNQTIENNIFASYSDGTRLGRYGWAIQMTANHSPYTGSNIDIKNNTFQGEGVTTSTHIVVWSDGGPTIQNMYVTNNISYGASNGLVDLRLNNSSNYFRNNLTDASRVIKNNYLTPPYLYVESDSLINTNPLFANVANQDFHLTSNSPAKDAGSVANAPPYDFDGISRPQGGSYDIGAYEYKSGSADTTVPAAPTGVTVK